MESFEQLAEQYKPMINKIITSLHIYNHKEEFYQLGLIALWQASTRFTSEKGSFTNYAYSYIKGVLLLELRKLYREKERTFNPLEEFWETAQDESPSFPLEKELLLSELTSCQRKWVSYTMQGFSIREIAERERVSVSAVKCWRSGARVKLKEIAADLYR